MNFNSTRDKSKSVSASFAIANGLSSDGGLYVPESFPKLTQEFLQSLEELEYYERAAKIISLYLTDYDYSDLLRFTKAAYEKFDGEPAPVVKIDEDLFLLELFHGPTCAFKDIALTLLPHLIVGAKKLQGIQEDIKILVATSGDTGKAALEGFRDVANTFITVFYPSEGVSDIQKLQMQTQEGKNVEVYGVEGNFDECQTAVKRLFASKEIAKKLKEKNIVLSSANSINFGRLVPQIVYYISAYVDLFSAGEINFGDKINFTVPTGNFGNILAGYYAKKMGLPINKLICASNSNNILTDFFKSGEYDVNREFFKTISPSMDILISSNLERLVYEMSGRNDALTKERMESLKSGGKYEISEFELKKYNNEFYASYALEDDTKDTIADFFDEYGYALDPHTAVAMKVYYDYVQKNKDACANVIVSTASPYKFAEDVAEAILEHKFKDAFSAIEALELETAESVPDAIADLEDKKLLHTKVLKEQDLNNIL